MLSVQLDLTLCEQYKMGLFETREEDLIGEDGLKREEVRGNYRQLHNVGLHVFYSASEIVWVL